MHWLVLPRLFTKSWVVSATLESSCGYSLNLSASIPLLDDFNARARRSLASTICFDGSVSMANTVWLAEAGVFDIEPSSIEVKKPTSVLEAEGSRVTPVLL